MLFEFDLLVLVEKLKRESIDSFTPCDCEFEINLLTSNFF